MTTRTSYTAEFGRQALERAAREDVGLRRAAQDLGISPSVIYRWREQERVRGEQAFPGQGRQTLTPEQQEIQRLCKENKILRQEREILKKAAACLGQNSFLTGAAPMRTLGRTHMGLGRFFARESR